MPSTDFQLFEKHIRNTMNFFTKKFMDMLGESPEVRKTISEETRAIEAIIIESCKPNIENVVNDQIEKSLSIPPNVVLPYDRVHIQNSKPITEVEQEIKELLNMSNQNILFMKYLEEELESYRATDVIEDEYRSFVSSIAETDSYNMNILLETLKKMETRSKTSWRPFLNLANKLLINLTVR